MTTSMAGTVVALFVFAVIMGRTVRKLNRELAAQKREVADMEWRLALRRRRADLPRASDPAAHRA